MLERMEALLNENSVLSRLDIRTVADMAIEDAVAEKPALWSQGRGRRDDYLEEMRVDHRYRDRFHQLHFKTA